MAKQTTRSRAEELLRNDLIAAGLAPDIGYQFHPTRGWRFDFAYPSLKPPLAIEIDGSGYHTSDKGKRLDQQKCNAAVELGWRVISYPARETVVAKRRERIVEQIKRILCGVSSPEDAEIVLVGD